MIIRRGDPRGRPKGVDIDVSAAGRAMHAPTKADELGDFREVRPGEQCSPLRGADSMDIVVSGGRDAEDVVPYEKAMVWDGE